MNTNSGGTTTSISSVAPIMYRFRPANTAENAPCDQSRVCSVSRISRTGADSDANPFCGDCAIRK